MGPADKVPPRPGFEWLDYPGDHVYVTKYILNCNYMQTLENEFADGHATFLHSSLLSQGGAFKAEPGAKLYGHYEIFETDYGAVSGRMRDNGKYILGGHWMMPVYSSAGAVSAPGTQPINMKLPMDDTHCVFFRLKWSHEPIKEEVIQGYLHDNYEFPTQIPGTYYSKANRANDYFIDRNQQKHFSYTGMWPYPVQDFAVVENQRGPLANRSREVLVSSDRYIIYVRRRLLKMAKDLQDGIEPKEPWQAQAFKDIRNFKEIAPDEPGYRLLGGAEAVTTSPTV
jgi:phthalate 4,5-dioxygenase